VQVDSADYFLDSEDGFEKSVKSGYFSAFKFILRSLISGAISF